MPQSHDNLPSQPTPTREAEGAQKGPSQWHYGRVLLVGFLLLAGLAMWHIQAQAPPPKQASRVGPQRAKALTPCPHWIGLSGAWRWPGERCLRHTTSWQRIRRQAAALCHLPSALPPPGHGMRLHITKATPGTPCQLRVLPLSAAKRVVLRIPIPLNQASPRDLAAIPGLHRSVAKKIVRYRQRHGDFRDLEALLQVRGVGPKTLQKISPFLSLEQQKQREAK